MAESTASPPEFDEKKQPGISFLGVDLIKLEFDFSPPRPEKLQYGLSFDNEASFSKDGRQLTYIMRVDLFGTMPEDRKPGIKFKAALVGKFESVGEGNMPLAEYAKYNAPGLMIPYVRELIANVTTRSPLPTLNLGPINVGAFLKGTDATTELGQSKKPTQNT